MIPCVSFTELFPDHHAPTSHYQTMIAGKHRIEHSKLTIFHITPPLPYSLLLPTPFPLRHFPFFFHSESPLSLSLRHSLVSQLLSFLFATSPLSCLLSYYFLSYSVTSLIFCLFPFHNGTVSRISLPLCNSLIFFSSYTGPHKPLYHPPPSTTAPFPVFPCRCGSGGGEKRTNANKIFAENLVYKINQFIFASRNIREVTGTTLLFAEFSLFFKVF